MATSAGALNSFDAFQRRQHEENRRREEERRSRRAAAASNSSRNPFNEPNFDDAFNEFIEHDRLSAQEEIRRIQQKSQIANAEITNANAFGDRIYTVNDFQILADKIAILEIALEGAQEAIKIMAELFEGKILPKEKKDKNEPASADSTE